MRGKLITIEGIDGCGKTTLCNSLRNRLPANDYLFTYEPYFNATRDRLHDPEEEQSRTDIFLQDRIEHCLDVISPALDRGQNVICDRYMLSTIAYQNEDVSWRMCEKPDLTLILRVHPPDATNQRALRDSQTTDFDWIEYSKMYEIQDRMIKATYPGLKVVIPGLIPDTEQLCYEEIINLCD
jgi:dTMP kinase